MASRLHIARVSASNTGDSSQPSSNQNGQAASFNVLGSGHEYDRGIDLSHLPLLLPPSTNTNPLVCRTNNSNNNAYRQPVGDGGLPTLPHPAVSVGVFWDFENCPLPGGMQCAAAVRRLRDAARKLGPVRCLKAYGKPEDLGSRMGELLACGVEVSPVAAGKEMADKAIILDAMLFALDAAESARGDMYSRWDENGMTGKWNFS